MSKADNLKAEFEVLVKGNMKRAYFTALGFLGSHDLARELSQEAFIRAYRNFNRFDRSKNFFTWYYKILKNLCLNFIRDSKKRTSRFFVEPDEQQLSDAGPDELLELKEQVELLNESLGELSPEDRELIVLKEFERMSYKEIAALLSIPEGSVMSGLFYARKRLADKMKRKLK
ncbi:MAG: sigma-70 family RNA polymerase sigma factor [Ignavibacteriaceae bacterium]